MLKKTIVALIGITMLTGACTNNPEESGDSAVLLPNATVQTAPPIADSQRSVCESTSVDLGDLWSDYQDTVTDAVNSGVAAQLLPEIKAAGRELVKATRLWIGQCGRYSPSDAADLEDLVDEFENSLSQL